MTILFYTPNSPYARTARIALREWNVLDRVEEQRAANRQADNPVVEFNPVGRVPTLVHDNLVVTEARNVFAYIKLIAGANDDGAKERDWKTISDEGQIVGFLDGIAFWVREARRSSSERSEFLLDVERDRTARCLDHLEKLATDDVLPNVAEFRGAALASALDLMGTHHFAPDWKSDRKALAKWFERQCKRRSMLETLPQIG